MHNKAWVLVVIARCAIPNAGIVDVVVVVCGEKMLVVVVVVAGMIVKENEHFLLRLCFWCVTAVWALLLSIGI